MLLSGHKPEAHVVTKAENRRQKPAGPGPVVVNPAFCRTMTGACWQRRMYRDGFNMKGPRRTSAALRHRPAIMTRMRIGGAARCAATGNCSGAHRDRDRRRPLRLATQALARSA